MLPAAIITITLALIFYTVGVWTEKKQGVLKPWHVIIFWCGLVFDTTGTSLMSRIAGEGFQLNFHGITGMLALLLMLFHVLWATVVLVRNNSRARASFHKLSFVVWLIWLVPYLSGMILGMQR